MLEHVMVSYYGTDLPLQQVASVTVPDPRQLMITPFDKNALGAIEKGIQKSEVNLTPNNDGTCIRLNIPPPGSRSSTTPAIRSTVFWLSPILITSPGRKFLL